MDGGASLGEESPRQPKVPDVDADAVETAAAVLRSDEPTALLIGGDATRGVGLPAAARIAEATGTRWYCETFPTRLERGAGIPAVDRIPYFPPALVAPLDAPTH